MPPTVTNWILSIKNLQLLWGKLQNEGFDFLITRNLNQDPLKNFFGFIRSHGSRNINPSCTAFKSAFKSLIINNFMASHSVGANCEEDESDGVLNSLKTFLDVTTSEVDKEIIPLNYGNARSVQCQAVNTSILLQLHGIWQVSWPKLF